VVYNGDFAGKMHRIDGRYVVAMQNSAQNVWCVVDLTDTGTTACLPPIAHAQSALVEPVVSGGQWGPGHRKIVSTSGTKYVTVVDVLKNNLDAKATHAVEFDTANANDLKVAHYGDQVYLSGGVLQTFDGERVSEAGYIIRPPQPSAVAGGAGGISVSTGWIYACVYEEIDAAGNVHVSGVSDPSTALTFTSKTGATVTVTHLTMSRRPLAADSSLRTAVYRTTDGGSVYYRVGTVANDLTVSTSTYADTTDDSDLVGNSKLYRQPGAVGTSLDRRAWPHAQDVTEYNGMLVVATEGSVQYSGQLVSGEAPWTSPIFEVPIPGEGKVTALAAQDGTLFAFKRRSIFALSGQAPADNGTGGGLGAPRKLAVDVGCIDPRSIVVTTLGVFFQSERGLEILTRAQSVQFIGQPVQDTLDSYPICTSATLDSAASLVRFELVDGETSNVANNYGVGLVYDLDNSAWVSVDKRTSAGATNPAPANGACMVKFSDSWVYGWLDNQGYFYTEASDSLDGSTWVTMAAQTAWFKQGGLMGKQIVNRVIALLSKVTDLDMDVQLGYDFRALETARSYTHTETAAIVTAETILRLEHRPHDDSDCMAVSVKLTDKTPTAGTVGAGSGAVWVGLTLDITPRDGAALTYDGSR